LAVAVGAACLAAACTIKPKPFTLAEFAQQGETHLTKIAAAQEPIRKPIDLYEAMARALKYNLNYQVEVAQTSLRAAELNLAHYSFLPNAVASSGYLSRNNYQAASSLNLVTNTQNFGASTSQDKTSTVADITLGWNILDFGLSYVRAQQAADRVLIAQEMKRKVRYRLLEDVRTAYWRAFSYERLMEGLQRLEKRTELALANSRALTASKQTAASTTLTYERELTEIKRTIKELQRDLVEAKSQLAGLLNITPGTPFTLATSSRPATPPRLSMPMNKMIEVAVRDRVELREVAYQQRISYHEAHAALLEFLPGLQVFAAPGWDSNSFLLNSHWVSWGAKASWNLLKAFQYPARQGLIQAQDEVLATRGLAATMAVMTQVYASNVRFHHFTEELKVASEMRSVQTRLLTQIRIETKAGRVSEQLSLREELNALIAEAKYDIAYAGLQSAYAGVLASIGRDAYEIEDRGQSLEIIANALRLSGFELGEAQLQVSQIGLRKQLAP